ncbi:MAG: class I SAM-dependent methyltransferase [Bryobacteraceae bacterium]
MSCLMCGHAALAPRFTAGDRLYGVTEKRFQIAACARCGLLQLDPLPAASELPAYYPANYWFAPDRTAASRLEEAYRRLVLRDHIAFVERALRDCPPGPVLDVGCGGGLLLGMLARDGYRAVGLDLSVEAAAIAAERDGVVAVCGSLEHAPLREGCCAAVTMFHVVEHLRDPRAYLRAAHALLKPGGRLVVQAPNAACWQFRLLGRAWTGIDVPRHLGTFRASDLKALVEDCGFNVLREKHFSLRDNPAGLASSLAPRLDPMARRIRRVPESAWGKLAKDAVYFALVLGALPFAAAEAAFRAGSTVMLEARRV